MRYIAAYLLAQLGGSAEPSKADLEKILGSVGVDCEADAAQRVLKALKGKSVQEVIAAGSEKLAAVPSGGGAAAAAPAAGGGGAAAADAPAAAKKEDKKKKEESEEEDDDMGFGLFD